MNMSALSLRTAVRASSVSLLLVLLLAGCGRSVTSSPEDPSNLESWVAEVNNRPPPPLDPLPVMQQFETFEYAAQTMRDPFSRAFTDDSGGSGPRPDSKRRKQPLELYPLDTLDMVGTIGAGALVGLITAPDKTTYRVRPGMYLGQNDGRVTGVREDRIDLVELASDGAGGWLERPASIALDDQ